MFELNRREFAQGTLGTLLTYSLLESLSATDAIGQEVRPIAAKWLAELNETSQDLRGKELTQLEWQSEIEKLMKQVPLAGLLQYVDFERWIRDLKFRDPRRASVSATIPKGGGITDTACLRTSDLRLEERPFCLFPHGHNNMATAFLILDGRVPRTALRSIGRR